ncbi:MAG: TIGR03086 family metal-binding protein [Pseudonocardiaceae bacterium]
MEASAQISRRLRFRWNCSKTHLSSAITPSCQSRSTCDAATPCTQWTVRDLLAYIAAVNRKYTGIALGDPWELGVPVVDLKNDPARAYHDTIRPLLEAWKQPGALQRELELPVGRKSAELALWVHLRETLVHGWDLAAATKQWASFDDEVVEASLAHAQQLDPVPAARPAGLGFAGAVDAPASAEPIIRLAAFFGRDVSTWSWT